MKGQRFLVLGYFGFQSNQLDGQTIKTRNVLSLLEAKGVDREYFDTEDLKFNKLALLRLVRQVLRADVILYLPAHNNLKYFFPVLFLLTKIFRARLYYLVVGGWLPTYLQDKSLHRKLLSRIDFIFCETYAMINALKSRYGFQNVGWFPNFRIHQYVPATNDFQNRLRIVFFSRINVKKGIDYLLNYARKVDHEKLPVVIDFYGPVADADAAYFHSTIPTLKSVRYLGVLQPDLIHGTLNQYDILVLPTKYFTEGFPGAILDAYIAGIPVIVSEWMHAREFVEHEKTGLIFTFGEEQDFEKQMDRVLDDPSLISTMKNYVLEKSRQYSSEKAWELICQRVAVDQI